MEAAAMSDSMKTSIDIQISASNQMVRLQSPGLLQVGGGERKRDQARQHSLRANGITAVERIRVVEPDVDNCEASL
jgi:hypothetical protein